MYTLQDLEGKTEGRERIEFLLKLIEAHQTESAVKTARIAEEYFRQQNTTITQFQKTLRNLRGQAVPDIFSANYRLPSNFFNSFVTQQNQYLLGNGLMLTNDSRDRRKARKEKEKLGKRFDNALQRLGRDALVEGVAFGFWNLDHMETFRLTEFVPLYNEETGALEAGVRFWQIDTDKPLRFTLYEKDGYTDYIRRKHKEAEIFHEKRAYIQTVRTSEIAGEEITDGTNYPTFPIIPLWGNPNRQSELVGLREKIDCYDLIESGFANDLDDLTSVYWILHNAGGMEDTDLAQFVERLKTVHAAPVDTDGGAGAEAHTIDIPYEAREAYLTRLEQDMYKDFCIVNVTNISGGQKTATEISAAYTPMDTKADMYEYCVIEFLLALFELVGVEGEPVFKRNRIVNQTEETNMVLAAAQYMDDEAVLRHLPWLTPDEVDGILQRRAEGETERLISRIDEIDRQTETGEVSV